MESVLLYSLGRSEVMLMAWPAIGNLKSMKRNLKLAAYRDYFNRKRASTGWLGSRWDIDMKGSINAQLVYKHRCKGKDPNSSGFVSVGGTPIPRREGCHSFSETDVNEKPPTCICLRPLCWEQEEGPSKQKIRQTERLRNESALLDHRCNPSFDLRSLEHVEQR